MSRASNRFGYRDSGGNYPPARTGLRGSHEGSFEIGHHLALARTSFARPAEQTDDTYDLVVVGAGISGLTAAWSFREAVGPGARILVLDNHDDFGGHAQRNEFTVDGRTLIGYAGSQTLVAPTLWSKDSRHVLQSLDVEHERFREYFDLEFYDRHMKPGIFFNRAVYGQDKLAPFPFNHMRDWVGMERAGNIPAMIAQYPVSAETREKLTLLFTSRSAEVYPGLSPEETTEKLRHQSYTDYLRERFDMPEEGVLLLRDYGSGGGVAGLDAQPASYAPFFGLPLPGLENLDWRFLMKRGVAPPSFSLPDRYIAHFPDGNASVARLLVRSLVPKVAPGSTMEDVVTARFDYEKLDVAGSACCIRLSSTAVGVRHSEDGGAVDVTYVQAGRVQRVRGKHVVMACWNKILPYLCPEMGESQREALEYPSKMPVVFTNVALRNWRPIHDSGFGMVYAPQSMFTEFYLDFPVSIGDYRHGSSPDEPAIVVAMLPLMPRDSGLPNREQHKAGRHKLMLLTLDDFERGIHEQFGAIWGPYGLDPDELIAGITVNRWPHGYAYDYNPLFDPDDWDVDNGPHIDGRAQLNRISIANSDAGSNALANVAMDEAIRAVQEQLRLRG